MYFIYTEQAERAHFNHDITELQYDVLTSIFGNTDKEHGRCFEFLRKIILFT